MSNIKENLKYIHEVITQRAAAARRDPAGITLVAVTKTVSPELINEALAAGVTDIGENRVQEAVKKGPALNRNIHWHLIGHLQTNKVKPAIKLFELIHSVDSLKLLEAIDEEAGKAGKIQNILIEVNISGEDTKYGCQPDQVLELIKIASVKQNVQVSGLMTIAPFTADRDQIRGVFRGLRELKEKVVAAQLPQVEMKHLSMGMSNDFEIAIEEGATILRIGTAIFGKR